MKSKLTNGLRALVLLAIATVALAVIPAAVTRAADKDVTIPAPRPAVAPVPPVLDVPATPAVPPVPPAIDPSTGLPVPSPPVPPVSPVPPIPFAIDPSTGLPLPSPPPWKDPNWPDPNKVLPEVVYDGLPLSQVSEHLRKEFREAFDVLIPNSWQDPSNPTRALDPRSFTIKMELKRVRASEVFNAMNLMFEAENTPCRWELKLNGNRPTAMLRVLSEQIPTVPLPPSAPAMRMVYFVGDLIGDDKQFGGGGPTMEQLFNTLSEVFQMSYGPPKAVLQFHQKAQLVIVTGTPDQIQFVQQTLMALREKSRVERKSVGFGGGGFGAGPKDPKVPTDETKPR